MVAIKNKSARKKSLATCVSMLFLLLYFVASLQVDSFHDLLHSREAAALHSPEQELNSCHNAIYHQQKDNVCQHQSHISVQKKCPLCHIAFHSTHLPAIRFAHEQVVSSDNYCDHSFVTFSSSPLILLPSRGPPSTNS